MEPTINPEKPRRSPVTCHGGRIWYTQAAERRIFFVLTLIMLGAGLLYKLGVW